ncbi:MAG: SUF system NifU family Fe-S cluster assembly protein [Alphaproteobacteria bacterium]
MSDDLRELYQEVILDHGRHPRNFARPADANREAHGNNPLCGDTLTVWLSFRDGVVADVGFEGRGCAISVASASLMTEILKGKSEAQAEALFERFRAMVSGDSVDDGEDSAEADRLRVLAGVRDYPMRIKCATLAWHTMNAALHGADQTTTE